jgi:hypothetical protein
MEAAKPSFESFIYTPRSLTAQEREAFEVFRDKLAGYTVFDTDWQSYSDGRICIMDNKYRREYGTKADPLFTKEDFKFLKHYPDLKGLFLMVQNISLDEETCQNIAENASLESLEVLHTDPKNVGNIPYFFKNLKELRVCLTSIATEKYRNHYTFSPSEEAEMAKAANENLKKISVMRSLEKLDLGGSKISDASVESFKKMTNLKELDLSLCNNLSSKGLKEIMKALPNCKFGPKGVLEYKIKKEKEEAASK